MSFRDQDQISDYALTDPHEYVLRGARFQCNTEDAPLLTDFEQLQVTGSGDTLAYQFSHYGGTGPNPVSVTPPMLSQFGEQQHTPEDDLDRSIVGWRGGGRPVDGCSRSVACR